MEQVISQFRVLIFSIDILKIATYNVNSKAMVTVVMESIKLS